MLSDKAVAPRGEPAPPISVDVVTSLHGSFLSTASYRGSAFDAIRETELLRLLHVGHPSRNL